MPKYMARSQAVESPASCPICGEPWDFTTNGWGVLVVLHSVKKCIPKPFIAPEIIRGESEPETLCAQCRKPFRAQRNKGRASVTCSDRCRQDRKNQALLEKRKLLQKRFENAA